MSHGRNLPHLSSLLIRCAEKEGQVITFRARIHAIRRMSGKLVFIVFRQQTITIQGVLQSFQPHSEGGRKLFLRGPESQPSHHLTFAFS